MRRKLGATQEERGTWVEGTVLLLCAHASALSTFTWVLRLKLGPPGATQPSHYPPLPRQQNGSHSLLVQGSFVALSQSSLCKGPSVSLSFMDKRVHPGCVCVWVFKPRRGVATSRTWDKVTESSLLSGKLAGEKQ